MKGSLENPKWHNWKKTTLWERLCLRGSLKCSLRRDLTRFFKSKSNHFYCHITTAQVPWWVKFLWACSRQCRKTTDNLHMDRQCKKNNKQFIWTDSAKNCTGAFTVLQTVQKKQHSNLHMDRQCKKTTTAIYIWTDSAKNNNSNLHMDRQCKKKQQQFTYGQYIFTD